MADTTDMPSDEAREFARKHFDGDIDAAVFLDAFAAPYKAELKLAGDDVNRLECEVQDLESAISEREWPGERQAIMKLIRDESGYDGFDDESGVDLADELAEMLFEGERRYRNTESRAKAAEDENAALRAQVAALREVVGGLIALIQETANHDHQASDWGVFVRDARTALADTQATAARYRACTNADSTEAADNCNQFPKWIGPGVTAFSEDDLDLDG